jgi:signal transduction histidine kinase
MLHPQVKRYGIAITTVIVAAMFTHLLAFVVQSSRSALFFAAIAVTARYAGLIPGLLATVLSVVALRFLFIPSPQESGFLTWSEGLQLVVFSLVAVLISSLTAELRIARQRITQLYQQVQQTNEDLQQQVELQTAQLRQAVEELKTLNQLKDDFLSTVSHELRTPIANIKMALQMLKIYPSGEKGQRYLEILQRECDREASLINNLLDLQRLEAATYPEFLYGAVVIQEWLPALSASFQPHIQKHEQTLHLEIPSDLPPLVTDQASLERIVSELLNNACKYTPASGHITVSAQKTPEGIHLSVSNSGVEISPEEQKRIFENFYRIPHNDPWKYGGTGLGLALVSRLVKHLGGKIGVESGAGQTTFTVEFPAT